MMKEGPPRYAEAFREATRFYELKDFPRLLNDPVIWQDICVMPGFIPEEIEGPGRWLERDIRYDGVGARLR